MSARHPSDQARAADDDDVVIVPKAPTWWTRYSPHGESIWSSAVSLVLHVLLLLLIMVAVAPLIRPDRVPPQVDVICLSADQEAAAGEGPGASPDDTLAAIVDEMEETPRQLPTQQLARVEQPQPAEIEIAEPLSDPVRDATQAQSVLEQVQAAVKRRLAETLADNSGGGDGGTAARRRGDRVARWVLHFDTRSSKDYLTQMDGLGGVIAFPVQGGDFRYVYDCSSANPRFELKDIAGENRLYWYDDKPAAVAAVCRALNVPAAPMMVVFLPLELEDHMLELELSYNNLEEDEIASTHFRTVHRDGRYDVVVSKQIAK